MITDSRREYPSRAAQQTTGDFKNRKIPPGGLGVSKRIGGLCQNRDLTERIGMQLECGTPKRNLGGGGRWRRDADFVACK